MQHIDPSVASEVRGIERKDAFNSVDHHGCHQPGIVCLFSGDSIRRYQAPPLRIDLIIIGEPENQGLHARPNTRSVRSGVRPNPLFSTGRVQTAQSSMRFCDSTQARSPVSGEPGYGFAGLTVLRMGPLEPAQENIGVGKYVHYWFQSSSRV
jgi:hypothetical protein